MYDAKRVVTAFLSLASDSRDPDGAVFKEDSQKMPKEKALKFIKNLYPDIHITTEQMPGGLAYFGKFPIGSRKMLGNYSFNRSELWYKLYPGTKDPHK